jgi:hypothetical protein
VSPAGEDEVEVIDAEQGAARLGGGRPDQVAASLDELGIIRVLPDGRWELPAPALFRAAEELAALDFPLARRIEIMQRLRGHAEQMADLLVEFFVDHLWPDSATLADDPEAWTGLTRALDRLRPLATTSVVAMLDQALAGAAERATERMLAGESDGDGAEPATVTAPGNGARQH